MNSLTRILIGDITEHGIDLLRLSESSTSQVIEQLRELADDIRQRLRRSGVSAAQGQKLRAMLKEVRELITTTYREILQRQIAGWTEWATMESEITSAILRGRVGAAIGTGSVLPRSTVSVLVRDTLIQGSPAREWWARQAADTAFRFAQAVRIGMMAGETNARVVARVDPVIDVSARHADALVRSSVQTVTNTSRLETFRRNRDVISGVIQVSTLDARTTDICIAYDGATWDLDGKPTGKTTLPFNGGPPRHIGCRSALAPITKTWRELGINAPEMEPGERASADGPVSATMTYGEWLKTRTAEEQNRILGRARAELWRRGKLSVRDLLDRRGRPLTVDQIRSKHGI